MKYFFDTEFSSDGLSQPIEFISIGMVDEAGRELYRENKYFDVMNLTPWVHANVVPHLVCTADPDNEFVVRAPVSIAADLVTFVGDDPRPEFWVYYGAYDYVILSQLMGDMEDWPQGWPYYARDLRQALDYAGHTTTRQPDDAAHDALQDARWIRDTFLEYREELEGIG